MRLTFLIVWNWLVIYCCLTMCAEYSSIKVTNTFGTVENRNPSKLKQETKVGKDGKIESLNKLSSGVYCGNRNWWFQQSTDSGLINEIQFQLIFDWTWIDGWSVSFQIISYLILITNSSMHQRQQSIIFPFTHFLEWNKY